MLNINYSFISKYRNNRITISFNSYTERYSKKQERYVPNIGISSPKFTSLINFLDNTALKKKKYIDEEENLRKLSKAIA